MSSPTPSRPTTPDNTEEDQAAVVANIDTVHAAIPPPSERPIFDAALAELQHETIGPEFRPVYTPWEGGRCPICLCEWEAGEQVTVTPCGHYYHDDCFRNAVGDARLVCPEDRSAIFSEDLARRIHRERIGPDRCPNCGGIHPPMPGHRHARRPAYPPPNLPDIPTVPASPEVEAFIAELTTDQSTVHGRVWTEDFDAVGMTLSDYGESVQPDVNQAPTFPAARLAEVFAAEPEVMGAGLRFIMEFARGLRHRYHGVPRDLFPTLTQDTFLTFSAAVDAAASRIAARVALMARAPSGSEYRDQAELWFSRSLDILMHEFHMATYRGLPQRHRMIQQAFAVLAMDRDSDAAMIYRDRDEPNVRWRLVNYQDDDPAEFLEDRLDMNIDNLNVTNAMVLAGRLVVDIDNVTAVIHY